MLLVDGFSDTGSTSWRNLNDALSEVRESFQPERISRIAIDEAGNVQGWIGGLEEYEGNVWELHPLVVHRDCRKRGKRCSPGPLWAAICARRIAPQGGTATDSDLQSHKSVKKKSIP